MMKILSFLSTLASVIYLFVGIYTYRLNKKTREGILFLLLNIFLSVWSFTYAFVYVAEDSYEFSFWYKISAAGWCFFPAIVLYLTLTIIHHKILEKKIIKYFISVPGLILWFKTLFLYQANKPETIFDFFYSGDVMYAIYNYSYIIGCLYVIYLWGKRTDRTNQKKQAKVLLFSGIMTLLLDIIYKVLFPVILHRKLPNITQIWILITLWGIYYAIVKYNFLLASNSLIINELFNEILDLTFLVDLDGKIIRTNRQVLNLLGMEWADLANTKITDLITEEKLEELISDWEKLKSTVKYNNVFIQTKDGKSIPLNISVSPIRSSKNQILLGMLIVGQDIRMLEDLKHEIASHKKTEDKLRKSEELFRTVAEAIPFSIIMARESDNVILYLNRNAENLLYLDHDELLGKLAFEFYKNPQDRIELLKDIAEGKPVKNREIIFKRSNNSTFTGLITTVTAIYNEEKVLLSVLGDITEQKTLQQYITKSEEMLKKLMDSIPDLVMVCDVEGNLTYVNKSIKTMLEYDPFKEKIPISILNYYDKADMETVKNNMKRLLKEKIGPVEYKCVKKDGGTIDVEVNSTVLREASSKPFGYIFVTRDITERKKYQEKLKRSKEEIEKVNDELIKTNSLLQEQSVRDSLTNLYNHRFIMELIEGEIEKAIKNKTSLCLMMLDIDYFKQVNDSYGHQIGDRVLKYVSKLIQLNMRDTDFVGRYGGEEFMILLPETKLYEAYEFAEKIRSDIQNYSFTVENLNVTISIGLAEYHAEDRKTFVDRVDELLYQAKDKGRNRIEMS